MRGEPGYEEIMAQRAEIIQASIGLDYARYATGALAFDYEALLAAKEHVEAEGLDVIGPTNHGIFQSIYFFDPNGHRLELVANTQTQEQIDELKRVAPAMLEEWSQTKKAPRHAAWLHELEFTGNK